MYPPDIAKTTFITKRGLYIYKVMSFQLKNVGATYQRLINHLFQHQIRRYVEVYIEDRLVISLLTSQHVKDLEETFQVLRKYHMTLKPAKYAFGVQSGKFLGIMVSKIENGANHNKIKDVFNTEAP